MNRKIVYAMVSVLTIIMSGCTNDVNNSATEPKTESFEQLYEYEKDKLSQIATDTKNDIKEDYNGIVKYVNDNYDNSDLITSNIKTFFDFYMQSIDYYAIESIKQNEEYIDTMQYDEIKENGELIHGVTYAYSCITSLETSFYTIIRERFPDYDSEHTYESFLATEISEIEEEKSDFNCLLYEDEKVKIYYSGISDNGVVFFVENATDANITIQADTISVNGESINSIIMSDDVAPQSRGNVIVNCDVDVNTVVETIGGQFRIIDFEDSFESYKAKFINVPIE